MSVQNPTTKKKNWHSTLSGPSDSNPTSPCFLQAYTNQSFWVYSSLILLFHYLFRLLDSFMTFRFPFPIKIYNIFFWKKMDDHIPYKSGSCAPIFSFSILVMQYIEAWNKNLRTRLYYIVNDMIFKKYVDL